MIEKITIITPCLNAEKWIGETLSSIINQDVFKYKKIKMQYIIVDGGSSDRTLDIVESAARNIPGVQILSGDDKGMYDALAKGIARAEGDICCYLNAGDVYHANALGVVAEVFRQGLARWLTGYHCVSNEAGAVTDVRLPWRYRPEFIQCGFYGTRLPVIQQESTFWSGELNSCLDLQRLSALRLAGDSYLWHTFSMSENLEIVQAVLGTFRKVSGQLSSDSDGYRREMNEIARRPSPFEKMLAIHDRIRFRWLRTGKKRDSRHITFDHDFGLWKK